MSAVKTLHACALACLFLLATSQATQAATLREALDQAWSAQIPAQNAQKERYSADIQASQAWTPEPPSIGFSHTTDQLNDNTGRREWEVELSTPVWTYGQRERATNVALAEQAAFTADSTLARLSLAGSLREAWWAARLAQLDFDLAKRKLAAEQEIAIDVSRRVKAGDLATTDDRQSKIAVLQAKKEVGIAQLAFERAQQSFTLLSRGAALPEQSEALQERSGEHPLLASLGFNANSAQAKLQQAAGDTRNAPEVALTYTSEKDASDEPYRGRVKVGIKIPFGSEARNQPRITAANAALIQAQTQLDLEKQQITNALKVAQAELAQSRTEQDIAAEQLQLANERAQWIEKGFRLGQFDLTTQLKSLQERFAAESEHARSRLAVDRAISRVNQAAGILP
ncbi:TolC family protein [Chitinibacter tainanensis]|uniref:TolC family protein n=1 Tax=Chitinibacter tainanensis TaxID=230667 RepID=UPI00235321EA|nr:TolC family protein [Chitinibacter tainanensis]